MIKAVIFDMYETLITLFESPSYFGKQIAKDLGIESKKFLQAWNSMEYDRSVGKITLEEALRKIMKENQCDSKQLLSLVVEKRVASKRECFLHLHPEILTMLTELKKREIKVGLISNCFSEEAMVIRESELLRFFDAVYLSYEQGIGKPDKEIFLRCMTELEVSPTECIYVGDGGSNELETAKEIGMKALQAVWYLKEGTTQPAKRKEDFLQLETPCEIIQSLDESMENPLSLHEI